MGVARRLVLVGGGHSHVEVLRAFGKRSLADVQLTVISRDRFTPYSGMLPGLVAGHYRFDDAHIHLARLAEFAGAELVEDEVVGLDLDARRVLCSESEPLDFDVVSVNIGSTPSFGGAAGAAEHAIPVKPIGQFLERWKGLRANVLSSKNRARIGIVGGGAGGVELALAMQYRLNELCAKAGQMPPRFHLVTAAPELLEGHSRGAARRLARIAIRREIELHTRFHVTRVNADGIADAAGRTLPLDHVLWVTDAAAAPWPRAAGLAVDGQGFILINDQLQSESHECVFAAGDIATMRRYPRPKSGVYAVRQGPPLAANLRAALTGSRLRPYRPQRHTLSLIGTGDRRAVANRRAWSVEGQWVWYWKRALDRRFMNRFARLAP